MDSPKPNYKEIIGANIKLVMDIYGKKRKEVCEDLDIKYTTFTDYIKGHTYPNIEVLNDLGYYFRIDGRDFLCDITKRPDILERLKLYAEGIGVNNGDDYHTLEEYYETPEGYPVELIRGRFYVCESPTIRHQSIVAELVFEIQSYIRKKNGSCLVFPGPIDVELKIDKDTVCVPDLVVICNPDLIKNMKRCMGAPDFVVEVISPSGRRKDLQIKRDVYEAGGVREYWVIDPFEDRVKVFRLDDETKRYPSTPEEYTFKDPVKVGIYEDLTITLAELNIV